MPVKYDKIGVDYNETRKADPYLSQQLIRHLAPQPTGQYLDVGCGTGNYTHALFQAGYQFVGLDPSQRMLDQAHSRNPDLTWHLGSAENTGLATAFFDGAIGTLTLHHWNDLVQGFSEIRRVLKPGARLVIFTSTPQQMQGYWLNHYFPKMLADSIRQMPKREQVTAAMSKAGFQHLYEEVYHIQPELQDHFLYCGKQQPSLYLSPKIRQGISSFSDLANQEEVQSGLQQLQQDITDDSITAIMRSYENDEGDYLYLIAKAV